MTQDEFIKTALTALGGGGVTSLVLYFAGWIRYKPKDKADADKTRAEAQVLIAGAAMTMVDRLTAEIDQYENRINKMTGIEDGLKVTLEKTRANCEEREGKLQMELKEAQTHQVIIKTKVGELHNLLSKKTDGLTQEQLERLVIELKRLTNGTATI